MKQLLRKLPYFLVIFLLTSCASRYAPKDQEGFGYSNKRVSENIFDIHYKGNRETLLAEARKYAYKRAAELTLASGYTHFSVLEEKEISSYNLPSELAAEKAPDVSEKVQSFTITGGQIQNPEYPEVRLTIYCSYASDLQAGIDARKWNSKEIRKRLNLPR